MSSYKDCLQCGHCEWCIERSIDEWEYHNRQQAEMGEPGDDEPYCETCGNTGWVFCSDGLGIECGECNL
jgi:hypothetical protein